MAETLLAVDSLNKRFLLKDGVWGRERGQVVAARNVTLAIARGETLGLVGESGCGKTTLSRMILGLEEPDSGSIRFKGVELLGLSVRQRRELCADLQVIFQDPFGSLNPRRTIGQSVAEPLVIHGRGDRQSAQAQAVALLGKVGIDASQFNRYPHQFSGGQRQRIAIARALALKPELLILDEPVSALDVSIQAQVVNLLLDLKAEFNLSYLFISHDLALVGYLADRVAVMQRGCIVEIAPTARIFAEPLHPYTQSLIKSGKVPEGGDSAAATEGCPFAARCPRVEPQCRVASPELEQVAPGHWVACRRAEADK